MFASIVRRYQAWKRYETDRELSDIGLNRSDIDRIACGEAYRQH